MGTLRLVVGIGILWLAGGGLAHAGEDPERPEAFAGEDQEIEPCAARLCCHGADPLGRELSYGWAQTDGPERVELTAPGADCVDLTLLTAGDYSFECTVDNGRLRSAPDEVRVRVANAAPTCDAGFDSHCMVGERCLLDGRRSADPNGDPLFFRWVQTAPEGAPARLTGAANKVSGFVPAQVGRYCFQVECRDHELAATLDEVCVVVNDLEDWMPVAHCGRSPLTAGVGEAVQLDARRSYDADGFPLSGYRWRYAAGPDPDPVIEDPDERRASFVSAGEGVHVLELTVRDTPPPERPGEAGRESVPCRTVVQVKAADNQPPFAMVGDGVAQVRGGRAVLDGSGSRDPDGDPLTYRWTQLQGPRVTLSDADSPAPSFSACAVGIYRFELVVSDGRADSLPAEVWATVHSECNLPPVADAGDSEQADCVAPGVNDPAQRVELDGRGSHDPDAIGGKTSVKFQWLQTQGLHTPIRLAFSALAYVEPIQWDHYGYRLFALDSWDTLEGEPEACWAPAWSLPADVSKTVHCPQNHIPIADAGPDGEWLVGDEVLLDGCDSVDGDGDELLHRWRQVRGPAVVLDHPGSCMPSFLAAEPGTWCFELRVDDSWIESMPDTVCHHVIPNNNQPPVARCPQGVVTVRPGQHVLLDGGGSFDSNGDELSFRWSQTCGHDVVLSAADSAFASFRAPQLDAEEERAELCFRLAVSDGRAEEATCDAGVEVVRPPPPAEEPRPPEQEPPRRPDPPDSPPVKPPPPVEPPPEARESRSGCSCELGGATDAGGAGPGWLLAALALTAARRRRRP